uniref:V-SNARE coiled-coil homology domain-containing protein n=1 Tax=Angiostrongylus cantonensis TaxID=6313 RepID=A0A0K0D9E9_ANGCA
MFTRVIHPLEADWHYCLHTLLFQVNVEKVLERDQKLSQLDDRADALQEGASQFEKSAATLKRKYWWKNIKMMIIMCAITVILIIIIVLWVSGK